MAGTDHLERLTKVGKNFLSGFTISASVGDWAKGAKNLPDDVETVQLLLEAVARQRLKKELDPKGIDGEIARAPGKSNTVKASRAFQYTFMTGADGLVEPEGLTLKKLREEVQDSSGAAKPGPKSVMDVPHPGDGKPPWLHSFDGFKVFSPFSLLPGPSTDNPSWISVAEEELGEKEIATRKENNPRILEYHATTSGAKTDESPWCASFVNWVLEQSGFDGAGSAATHKWKKWGDGLAQPAVGSVAFIDWGKVDPAKHGKGHVGFVVGKTAKGRIVLLGGNQSNQVRYTAFKESLIQTYRVPKGYVPSPRHYNLPIMEITDGGGGFTATR
jgi:uncharacterized protein (TIGR02594 family)